MMNMDVVDLNTSLELKLLEFYHSIFVQEKLLVSCSVNLGNALESVIKAYSSSSINSNCSKINFVQPEMRCSYIFRYAPCFSSTVAQHFQKVLLENPPLLEAIRLADEINVCSLGGGPATEFAAIAKRLEEIATEHRPRDDRPLNLAFTSIDIDAGWAETTKKIEERLVHFVDTSVLKCTLSFIEADLTKPLSEEVQDILKKSNFVTMTKFISAVYGKSGAEGVSKAMQAVVPHIQEHGVLLLIDSSRFGHYDTLQTALNSPRDMTKIYDRVSSYEMSQSFLNESHRLYDEFYSCNNSPCHKSTNCICAWQRKQNSQ